MNRLYLGKSPTVLFAFVKSFAINRNYSLLMTAAGFKNDTG